MSKDNVERPFLPIECESCQVDVGVFFLQRHFVEMCVDKRFDE